MVAAGLRVGSSALDGSGRVAAERWALASRVAALAAEAGFAGCAIDFDAAGGAIVRALDVRGRAVVRGDDSSDLLCQSSSLSGRTSFGSAAILRLPRAARW